MKIVATRVNEHDEMEYTVVPTVEERNWMAVYINLCGNLCECEMGIVDRFAARAWDYGFTKCGAFVRLLNAWLAKLEEVGGEDLKRMYGAVLTNDEAECLLAHRNMTSSFNRRQADMLGHVIDRINKYDPEECGMMLDVMWTASKLLREGAKKVRVTADDGFIAAGPDVPDDEAARAHLKRLINSVYGVTSTKLVHPDEDCVLPGCDRYGGNDTYLRIRKVLGHKGAFDFCMGNVVKLVDRWDKKGDPVKNLEKLRDYSAQALVEWRLYNEMLS